MAMYFWICPECGLSLPEDYLKCTCSYVTTKEEVEKNKLELKEIARERLNKREVHKVALEKKSEEERRELQRKKEEERKELEEYEKMKAQRIQKIKDKKQNPSNNNFIVEYTSYNQYKHVKKEEVKKEIKQEHINKKDTQSVHNKQNPWKAFSWKSFLIAVVIAAILNVVLSAATDSKPTRNIVWTALWFYLTIESWKYWSWKALIPYPAYLVCAFILGSILVAFGVDKMPVRFVLDAMNIGGLIIFYKLLKKSVLTD